MFQQFQSDVSNAGGVEIPNVGHVEHGRVAEEQGDIILQVLTDFLYGLSVQRDGWPLDASLGHPKTHALLYIIFWFHLVY